MSDGVWKYAGWNTIISAAKQHEGQAMIDTIADAARLKRSRTFQDDFTLVTVQSA
jgi:hypothetical protein